MQLCVKDEKMASIERTAYPRFKRTHTAQELDALYTPNNDELSFSRALARRAQIHLPNNVSSLQYQFVIY